MKFSIASIYAEVGCSFPVSYKVRKLLMNKIDAAIVLSERFIKRYADDYSVGIIVSTNSQTREFKIMGPTVSKRYKVVDFSLWIPYQEVMESDNILKAYLEYLCDGIVAVLNKYDFETAAIIKICEEVKQEVIDNPEYADD